MIPVISVSISKKVIDDMFGSRCGVFEGSFSFLFLFFASYNRYLDSSLPLCTNIKANRSSISMSTNPITITMKSDERDSLNNGLLFQPIQSSTENEPFFLSSSKIASNNGKNTSSTGTVMQTSTLIISAPSQYHYYLCPPTSLSRKNLIENRSISNASMNSISTNSSSSNTSCESQVQEFEDETSAHLINNQNNIHSLKLSSEIKPVILSDSVQAFWPPTQSVFNNNSEQRILMESTTEQVSSPVY